VLKPVETVRFYTTLDDNHIVVVEAKTVDSIDEKLQAIFDCFQSGAKEGGRDDQIPSFCSPWFVEFPACMSPWVMSSYEWEAGRLIHWAQGLL